MNAIGWLRRTSGAWPLLAAVLLALHSDGRIAWGQEDVAPSADAVATEDASLTDAEDEASEEDAELAALETELGEKYRRLEEVLLRMAELNARTDPDRAALLRKVVGESKDRLVAVQFDTLVDLLGREQFSRAIENSEALDADLLALLELLESENRAENLASEKERYKKYLEHVNKLIKRQKSLQGRTGGAVEPERLADEQGELADDTNELGDEIDANEGNGRELRDPNKSSGEPGENGDNGEKNGESGEKSDSEGEKNDQENGGDGEKSDGESGEKSDGESGEKSDGESSKSDGQPSEGSSGQSGESDSQESPPSQPQNPTAERLQAAREAMKRAEERLKEAEKDGAVDEQEAAIRELEKARAELEEILRQLREEEIMRTLEMLEVRFVRMLEWQKRVLEGTQRLHEASGGEDLSHAQEIESSRLSLDETKIVNEADRALLLLREEGSAVAFPEALEQTRDDMQDVADRLMRSDVGLFTQGVEEDIIAALQEMLDALEKAMEESEQRQNQPSPPGAMQQDPALVDLIAELKLIRSLQQRVNDRTERYGKLIDGEQADQPDLLKALEELSDREERIFEITRELELEQRDEARK